MAGSEISPHVTEDEISSGRLRVEGYRFIAGHFSLPAQARIAGERYRMTLVREPIEAIVSTYTFWRGSCERNLLTAKARELPFGEFVRFFADAPSLIHNRLTHHFAGMPGNCTSVARDGRALLEAAKQNLAAFDFVGICEEFEASAALLCRNLGWRLPADVPHENRSRRNGERPEIDRETMKLLRERTALDGELYEFARRLFDDRAREGDGRRAAQRGFAAYPAAVARERNACIESVSARWAGLGQLSIAVTFHTLRQSEEFIVGVKLEAPGGPSWGTNTAMEKLQLDIAENSRCRATFMLHVAGAPGRYSVTAALHSLRRAGLHDDWREGAAFFEIAQEPAEFRVELTEVRLGYEPLRQPICA